MPIIARILVSVCAAAASASAFTLSPRPLATAPARSSCIRAARAPGTFMSSSSLSEGDTVVVFGATGRIGKLVADKLLEGDKKYRVRLIANNAAMAEDYVGTGAEGIFVGGLGRVPADETPTLLDISRKGMVVDDKMGTGIRMSTPGAIVPLREVLRGADAIIMSDSTTMFPSKRWLFGESPTDTDVSQVQCVLGSAGRGEAGPKRVVYMSAMGSTQDDGLFWVLNRFGALTAKRQGEDLVRGWCESGRGDWTIVRPKLHCYEAGPFGSPSSELLEKLSYTGLRLVPGDVIDGETSDMDAAEALVQSLTQEQAANRAFCVSNTQEGGGGGRGERGQGVWDAQFGGLAELEARLRAQGVPV